MLLKSLIPILCQLQQRFSNANMCCTISTLTTSSLNLITHVQVLHSYIIWPVMYFKSKLDYTCASSPFIYNLTGHVTIDHLNIINSTSL